MLNVFAVFDIFNAFVMSYDENVAKKTLFYQKIKNEKKNQFVMEKVLKSNIICYAGQL